MTAIPAVADDDDNDYCHVGGNPRFVSPTAMGTNRLLWGDWNKGNYGILVRAPDIYDDNYRETKDAIRQQQEHENMLPLLPASFVHSSLRSANSIYPATTQTSAALLIGSRFSMNNNRRQHYYYPNGNDDEGDEEDQDEMVVVNVSVCYPSDAGSNKRMALLVKNGGGRGCHPKGITGICLNNSCLTTHRQHNCACNSREVPPATVGSFMAEWLQWAGGKQHGLDRFICWYDLTSNHGDGFAQTVTASNSLWLERAKWCRRERDEQYMGWTECPATSNVRSRSVVDAIVVRLPVTTQHNMSLCDYDDTVLISVQRSLAQMRSLGYTDDKPIVFMEQVKGMTNEKECYDFWNGVACQDGYRKEIFSQEFNFTDGSRLAVPTGCSDVYYFPFDYVTLSCTVSSDACQKAERQSPYHLDSIAITNARLLSLQDEASGAATFDLPNYFAVSFVSLLVCALSAGVYFFVLRRKRGLRSRPIV